jgi:hypothetical protein
VDDDGVILVGIGILGNGLGANAEPAGSEYR